MAKNVTIAGASYSNVPAIYIPISGGGTAEFKDCVGQKEITENGTFDVSGFATILANISASPVGCTAFAAGNDTLTTAVSTTARTVTHNLGVVPDLVMYFALSNISSTYNMLLSARSTTFAYRSGYSLINMYHGSKSTTISMNNSNTTSAGVYNFTTTTFSLKPLSTSYTWKAGDYMWIAIKY